MAPYEEVRVSLPVFSEVSYIQRTLVRVVDFSDRDVRCKSDLSCSRWPHTYLLTPGDRRGNSSASSRPFPPFYFLSPNFSSGTLSVYFLLFQFSPPFSCLVTQSRYFFKWGTHTFGRTLVVCFFCLRVIVKSCQVRAPVKL